MEGLVNMIYIFAKSKAGFPLCSRKFNGLFSNLFSYTAHIGLDGESIHEYIMYIYLMYVYNKYERSGRPGFNRRSRHTKDFKNGT